MKKVLVAFGTRPEIIKLAPVISALKGKTDVTVLHTGQHIDLAEPMLSLFDIEPEVNLGIMKEGQNLFGLTSALTAKLGEYLSNHRPDYVIVQGDTTTAYLTALSAFYVKIPVLHVEAGLRSYNHYYPFPEEINRRLITQIAHFHFAPTHQNKQNLMREGVAESNIVVTGNTVIDAMQMMLQAPQYLSQKPEILQHLKAEQKLILLTAHRRENHGKALVEILEAVREIVDTHPNVTVIFPAHPNPEVQKAIQATDIKHPRFLVTPPFTYLHFMHLLNRSDIILTDSGGIQEEASALGKSILVLRNETERQELIDLGLGILAGTSKPEIIKQCTKLLNHEVKPEAHSVFGDGKAAERIRDFILSLPE